jgi:hypothetical protein
VDADSQWLAGMPLRPLTRVGPAYLYPRRLVQNSEPTVCPNCEAVYEGNFCNACGQKRMNEHDKSLGHFFHELFHEIVHLDGRLWSTVKALLLAPGTLTLAHWQGRRGSHIGPVRLFLTAIALNYLALFNGPLDMRNLETYDRSGLVRKKVEDSAKKRNLPVPVIEAELSRSLQKVYSIGQYFCPFALAVWLWLLFRKQRPYYTDHLIAALHCYSFFFLAGAVATPVAQWLFGTGANPKSAYVTVPILFVYWLLTVRTLYGRGVAKLFSAVTVWAWSYVLIMATMAIGIGLTVRAIS